MAVSGISRHRRKGSQSHRRAPTRDAHARRVSGRVPCAAEDARERSKMSCKCCGKPADPEERRANEMYAGPAFHLAPPPKPPAPRRLENSWQHEWDASDRPPLYEAPKPNAFRPPPPAPRIPPAAAARMAGLDSPTVRAPMRDDEREGEVDDGAAGATSPAGTADSAEAVRAALGLSPRSPGGRADAAGNPSSPAAFGDVVEPKNAAGVSASRAFANAPANARNAAEWRASLALDPAKARQERQIGDLMASLGLNTRKKRRNLVYPDVLEPSSAAQLAQLADDARMNQAAGQTFERSARVDVASVSARATAFGPAMSPAVAEARAADYPEAGAWGLRAEVARYDEARGGFGSDGGVYDGWDFAASDERWSSPTGGARREGGVGAGLGSLRR